MEVAPPHKGLMWLILNIWQIWPIWQVWLTWLIWLIRLIWLIMAYNIAHIWLVWLLCHSLWLIRLIWRNFYYTLLLFFFFGPPRHCTDFIISIMLLLFIFQISTSFRLNILELLEMRNCIASFPRVFKGFKTDVKEIILLYGDLNETYCKKL